MARKPYTPKPGFAFPGPPPAEALEFFRAKGLRPGFDHRDVWAEEHATSFTVAKAMELDLLAEIREEVDKALAEGRTFRDFARDLRPRLEARGWWGTAEQIDPLTGKTRTVQLGSPRRLRTIYRTNMRTARSAGQWERIERTARTHPFLLYQLGPSREHRPEHVAFHGLLLPVDDPFWSTHFPPNGWGCKCRVRQVSKAEAERLKGQGLSAPDPAPEINPATGLPTGRRADARVPVRTQAPPIRTREHLNKRTGEVRQVPEGIDPGWDYNPGQVGRRQAAAKYFADKIQAVPADLGAAAWESAREGVLPGLQAEYEQWARRVLGRMPGAPRGEVRVVGAMSPSVRQKLARLRGEPFSAALTLDRRELAHLDALARKGGKALPREALLRLPELLADARAVVWDGAGRHPALLYVLDLKDFGVTSPGRVAVRVDFVRRGGVPTNAVRSGSVVSPANLRQPGMELLEGEL